MKKQITLFTISFCTLIASTCGGCMSARNFNELAVSEEKESVDVIPYLELKNGDSVADLGAGGGYFSIKLAKAVGNTGKVYAVDINPESIAYIRKSVLELNIHNVEAVLGTYDDSTLSPGSVDLVFIRNAYHDFQNRVKYFARLKSVLKPGGRIAVIDYDPAKLGFFRKLIGHALDEKTIIEEMNQAGYVRQKGYTVLKQQSFNIFKAR